MKRIRLIYFCALLTFLLPCGLFAQNENALGSFSPFTVFGIGDIASQGSAYNKMMGGVGLATRNVRHINFMNPAAISVRDTLSFMADFGVEQKNSYFKYNDAKSLYNTFNMYDFVMTFPIYKSSAFAVGILPYSNLGYHFSRYETDDEILAHVGDVQYDDYGEGSIYSLFLSGSVTFWKRLSIGAEATYYFGNLERHSTSDYSSSAYRDLDTGTKHHLNGFSGKFGMQYEQPLGKGYSLTAGATYRLSTTLKGVKTNFAYASTSSTLDTVYVNNLNPELKLADELGVGIAFKKADRWSVEFNYIRSDWRNTGIENFTALNSKDFQSTVSSSYRFGFEIVPNRYDVRYYMKRVAYRGGVYYNRAYYTFRGNNVDEVGITLGVTLPVFRLYNGINLGIDFGQRGGFGGVNLRERYFKFVIGFSLHDIWFQKYRYE